MPNKKNLNIKKLKIPLIGIHNIRNAVGALGVALSVGIPIQKIKKGLMNFKGVQRRFNKIFDFKGVSFFPAIAIALPFLVLALHLVLCPLTGNFFLCLEPL